MAFEFDFVLRMAAIADWLSLYFYYGIWDFLPDESFYC